MIVTGLIFTPTNLVVKHYGNMSSQRKQTKFTRDAQEGGETHSFYAFSSMVHFKISFPIHLSPGVLNFISSSNFFIEFHVIGTSEKIKFHSPKLQLQ